MERAMRDLNCDVQVELSQLAAEYWYRVDHPGAGDVAELYTVEGVMQVGDFRLCGRGEIREFFRKRNEAVPVRTTRHLCTNLLVRSGNDGTVNVHSLVTVFQGVGHLPLDSAPPSAIVDFLDIYESEGSTWQIRHRSGVAVFIGNGAARFITDFLPFDHPLKTHSP